VVDSVSLLFVQFTNFHGHLSNSWRSSPVFMVTTYLCHGEGCMSKICSLIQKKNQQGQGQIPQGHGNVRMLERLLEKKVRVCRPAISRQRIIMSNICSLIQKKSRCTLKVSVTFRLIRGCALGPLEALALAGKTPAPEGKVR